jgi:hypothetical protein
MPFSTRRFPAGKPGGRRRRSPRGKAAGKPAEEPPEGTEEKPAHIHTEVKEFIDAGMDLEAIKEAYADSQMSAGEIEEAYNRVVNPVSEAPKKGAKKGGSK